MLGSVADASCRLEGGKTSVVIRGLFKHKVKKIVLPSRTPFLL